MSPTSARTYVLLLALAAALLWNMLQPSSWPGDGERDGPLAAPPLSLPPPRCSSASTDATELVLRADELAHAARAHIARYPFHTGEGLRALAMLDEAESCVQQAGANAAALHAWAEAFRLRLDADYRDRVLRVERALVNEQPERARLDIAELVELLDGTQHAFAQHMRNLHAALADEQAGSRPR